MMMRCFEATSKTIGPSAAVFVFCTATTLAVGCGALDTGAGGDSEDEDDGAPVEKTYSVQLHTRNDDGCDSEGTPHEGDPYFELARVDEADGWVLGYYPCQALDECDTSGEPKMEFDEFYSGSERWRGVDMGGEEEGATCHLERTEQIVGLDGDGVELQRRRYSGELDVSGGDEQCDEGLVEEFQAQLACEQYDVVVAVPVDES